MSVGTVSRRGVGLVVAVLLAAFATATWVSYVRSIERNAIGGQAIVQVYVATATIPAGTPAEFAVERKLLDRSAVPKRNVAEGAVTDLRALQGRVAASTFVKGEQIVLARFVSPQQAGRLLSIPADKQAIAVEVDAPPAVAGFVQPRDRVSVLAKVDVNGKAEVRFLMQDVEVLAVGSRTAAETPAAGARDQQRRDAEAERPASSIVMTLAVGATQAEQLAFAILEGDVYFTLLPPGSKPASTPGRTAESLYR